MYEQKVILSVTGDLGFNPFYPLCDDIMQSRHICLGIAVVILPWHFLKSSGIHQKSKPTHHSLPTAQEDSTLQSWKISEIERQSGFGIEASNSIAKSVHASSTHSLKVNGTI
jgi:hypothetical protein